jgi:hypothetical protein
MNLTKKHNNKSNKNLEYEIKILILFIRPDIPNLSEFKEHRSEEFA